MDALLFIFTPTIVIFLLFFALILPLPILLRFVKLSVHELEDGGFIIIGKHPIWVRKTYLTGYSMTVFEYDYKEATVFDTEEEAISRCKAIYKEIRKNKSKKVRNVHDFE